MNDQPPPEFSKKKYTLIQAARSIKKLAAHQYNEEELITLIQMHGSFTHILEAKREEFLLKKPDIKIVRPGGL